MTRVANPLLSVPVQGVEICKSAEPEGLLTLAEVSARLKISRSKLERDVADGLPCLDLGRHHPGRRRKRSLRFSWREVLEFYGGRR